MNEWVIIEEYRDGGKWRHSVCCERRGREVMADLQSAHPARTYTLEPTVPVVSERCPTRIRSC